jgi:hypothetical protein
MLGKKRQERPQGSGTPPLRAGARLPGPGRGKKRPFRRRSDRSFLARRPLPSSGIMVSALGAMISTLEAFFSWRRHGEVSKRLRGHHGDMVMQERASWRKAGASRGCEKGDHETCSSSDVHSQGGA